MTHEFIIPVSDLDAAGKPFHFPIRAAWMRGALEDHEATAAGTDGSLDVRASKSGNDVVVHGTLKAELTVPCARCLEPVKVPIDEQVSVLMVPAAAARPPKAKAARKANDAPDAPKRAKRTADGRSATQPGQQRTEEEYEFTAADADTFPYEGETVVLDDFVRGELLLETPPVPLCSEDCPGISPLPAHGGAEAKGRDIDPRLLPLLRLKLDKE